MASTSTQNRSHAWETSKKHFQLPQLSQHRTIPPSLTIDMQHLQTTPPMCEFSKISDQNPNLQLLFAGITSSSHYKISFIKILFTININHVQGTILCPHRAIFLSFLFTATCLHVSPLLSFLLSPSLRYKITYSSNRHFSILRAQCFSFFFFLSYLQFYPSRKALVIKTHAFTIIINLNSFFTNPNINRQQRENYLNEQFTYSLLGVFPFCSLFFSSLLICFFFSFSSFHPACCRFSLDLFFSSFFFFLFFVVGLFLFFVLLFSLGFSQIFFSHLTRPLSAVLWSRIILWLFVRSSRFEITHVAWTGLRHQIVLCHILICRCMQKHIRQYKDERTKFFRKIYLSLYSKGLQKVLSVRGELETEQNCNILTPTLLAIPAFLSCSPGLLNRGLGAQPLLGHGSHSSIFTPTDLNFLSPGLYNNLTSTYFLQVSHLHSVQPVDSQGYPPISSTKCTCYLHRYISYFDSSAGGKYATE